MRAKSRVIMDWIYNKAETKYRGINSIRDAKKYIKMMNNTNPEIHQYYEKEVKPYWEQFGLRPKEYWYRLFSADGIHTDKKYIPENYWFEYILPYYSNMFFRRAYEDKCMHNVLFPDVKRPKTIYKNIAGQYYTEDFELLTKADAYRLLNSESKLILKPSIDSGAGRLIEFYDPHSQELDNFIEKIDHLHDNYIIQEVVEQHPVLSSLHKSSLNTIRVLSFFFEGEVHILSSIIRMGTGNAKVDNVTVGGMQCGINSNGQLYEYACTKKRDWVKKHPDGAVFSEIVVPSYKSILDIVKKEHRKLAHFRLIGWDFSVDKSGEPVLIEYNVCPGANQMTCGPTFGDLTDKVLKDVFIDKSLRNSKN